MLEEILGETRWAGTGLFLRIQAIVNLDTRAICKQ